MNKQETPKSETEKKELEKCDFMKNREEGALRREWTATLSGTEDWQMVVATKKSYWKWQQLKFQENRQITASSYMGILYSKENKSTRSLHVTMDEPSQDKNK